MRLSELVGKEIVNSIDGERMGVLDDKDIVINTSTGMIEAIVLQEGKAGFLGSSRERKQLVIPWQSVKTVGRDIIIVEMNSMGNAAYREW